MQNGELFSETKVSDESVRYVWTDTYILTDAKYLDLFDFCFWQCIELVITFDIVICNEFQVYIEHDVFFKMWLDCLGGDDVINKDVLALGLGYTPTS